MGLFGKKNKVPEGISVQFYEGELPGFVADVVCLLYLDNNILTIKRYDMDTVAKLPTDRITDIEMLGEPQFLQKYKGTTMVINKKDIPREFYVLHYINKDGDKKCVVFWGANAYFKMKALKEKLPVHENTSMEYEL